MKPSEKNSKRKDFPTGGISRALYLAEVQLENSFVEAVHDSFDERFYISFRITEEGCFRVRSYDEMESEMIGMACDFFPQDAEIVKLGQDATKILLSRSFQSRGYDHTADSKFKNDHLSGCYYNEKAIADWQRITKEIKEKS